MSGWLTYSAHCITELKINLFSSQRKDLEMVYCLGGTPPGQRHLSCFIWPLSPIMLNTIEKCPLFML